MVLKLLLEEKSKIKNVIIDVDVTLKSEHKSEGTFLKFLPYFYESHAIREHFKELNEFNSLYYIPFYRYLKFEQKLVLEKCSFMH